MANRYITELLLCVVVFADISTKENVTGCHLCYLVWCRHLIRGHHWSVVS
ncbi:UNVERIFIED_CONTAM: hypothetical protein GTU68_042912 [Idotea baltica]|nr:hypothetical protein [Idotea baltica]